MSVLLRESVLCDGNSVATRTESVDNLLGEAPRILTMTEAEGVLYKVTGEEYLREAERSAESLREHTPDVRVAIATDIDPVDSELFDDVIEMDELSEDEGVSTLHPDLIPYEKTVFLDSDTLVSGDIRGLFTILDEFDLAVRLSPGGLSVPNLPEPWTEYNTGVIAYTDSGPVRELFALWNRYYEEWVSEKQDTGNQPAFAKALHDSDVDFFTLPPEYNCRVPRYGYLRNEAKIVHGRTSEGLSDVTRRLNAVPGARVYYPTLFPLSSNSICIKGERKGLRSVVNLLHDGWHSLQQDGVKETSVKVVQLLTGNYQRKRGELDERE